MNQSWCLTTELPEENIDFATAICIQEGMTGAEEQDLESKVLMKYYFNSRDDADSCLKRLRDQIHIAAFDISAIEQQDWNARWRESMRPARLTDSIWVSPQWLPPKQRSDDLWIKIEPKMAFGTGHHETTRLAAQALISKTHLSNSRVLDIGAGSGVLSFAAGFKGASLSVGVEIDPVCLENIAENREANPTSGKAAFIIGSIDALVDKPGFDVVVMNMIRTHSEPLLQKCRELLLPGGFLVWSGILTEESKEVIASAQNKGFSLRFQDRENEWWCGVFTKS